ncbi:hypothetical protein BDV59DRAFT_86791 [Aspergillus ambiguus]|uniref:uncharacterized protein n=1 Tax=Aspergillus ambiguus TaxID=176160 RepID=UPI003CCE1C4D
MLGFLLSVLSMIDPPLGWVGSALLLEHAGCMSCVRGRLHVLLVTRSSVFRRNWDVRSVDVNKVCRYVPVFTRVDSLGCSNIKYGAWLPGCWVRPSCPVNG